MESMVRQWFNQNEVIISVDVIFLHVIVFLQWCYDGPSMRILLPDYTGVDIDQI